MVEIQEFPTPMGGKPLSAQDFAVIDTDLGAIENLQCVWCGMFLTKYVFVLENFESSG